MSTSISVAESYCGDSGAIAAGCTFIDYGHAVVGDRIDEVDGPKVDIVSGENVWIGKKVIVLKRVDIGRRAVVAAGAVVTKPISVGKFGRECQRSQFHHG